MLLARVAAELRANDFFSKRQLPVRFMEESQEVINVGDFWLEALFHLAVETAKYDPAFSQELRATRDDMAGRWHGDEFDLRARAAVLDAADRLGRRLVLMVENMQDLCAAVDDDFGWKLRETLQTQPEITLLATATSRFKELDDPAQPFFEQFRTLHLDPLETEECRRLWAVVSGDDVKNRGVRPLQILTGGSPRLLVIVAQFARHRSLRRLMEDLVTLIDDHSEYFRGHLQSLAKVERLVYLAVIDLWQPSSSSEIAGRCRRDIRTVSAMLGRLVNRGAVTIEGSGRKRRYAAAERLYSIYYKLRRERDEAAVIQNLIRFMAVFYGLSDLEPTIATLREATSEPVIRAGIERACAVDPNVSNFFSRALRNHTTHRVAAWKLFDESLTRFKRGEYDTGNRICSDLIERFGNSKDTEIEQAVAGALVNKGLSLWRQDRYTEAIEVYDEVIGRFTDSGNPAVQVLTAGALVEKAIALGREGRFAEESEAYDELVVRFGDSTVPGVQEHIVRGLFHKGETLSRQSRLADVIEVCDDLIERFGNCQALEVQGHVARALLNKGVVLSRADRLTDAIETYDELVERYGDSEGPEVQENVACALYANGVMLYQQEKFSDSIDVYDKLINRYGPGEVPDLHKYAAYALLNKGTILAQRDENTGAIEVYDELIERFGDSDAPDIPEQVAKALVNKGFCLWNQERLSDAITICDELVERFENSEAIDLQKYVAQALFNKGITLWQQQNHEHVIEVYDDLLSRFGGSDAPDIQNRVAQALFNKGVVLGQKNRFANAIEVYDELVERFVDSETPKLQETVAVALLFKADSYLESDRVRESLQACGEFEQHYKKMEATTDLELRGQARLIKTRALIRKNDIQPAVSLFRSVYAMFIPGDEMMINQMLKLLIDFAATGASRTLLEIMLTDGDKADKFAPFIVALRKELGEPVSASAEVMDVAHDIIERIGRRRDYLVKLQALTPRESKAEFGVEQEAP